MSFVDFYNSQYTFFWEIDEDKEECDVKIYWKSLSFTIWFYCGIKRVLWNVTYFSTFHISYFWGVFELHVDM